MIAFPRGLMAGLVLMASTALAGPPPPLEAYGDLPDVEDMAISPNGKRIAGINRINQERFLAVTEGSKALTAIPIGDIKTRGIFWAGDDLLVLLSSKTEVLPYGFTSGKVELLDAIVIPLNGGKADRVFTNRSSIANSIHGNYGIRYLDGKWKGFFGGIELIPSSDRLSWIFEHGRPALFEVDLANNKPRKVAPSAGEGHYRSWQVDAKGEVAATLELAVNGEWDIRNAERQEIARGVNPNGEVSLLSFGRTPETVLYSIEYEQTGDVRWFEVPLAGGAASEALAHVEIDRIFLDKADGTLLGYLQGDGPSPKPVMFKPEHQAIFNKLYAAFANYHLDVVDWTPGFRQVVVLTRGNGDNGTYYVVDMENLRAEAAGSERPLIHPEQVGPISTIRYKAADGLDLDGILALPPGREPKNLPVIMLPHGGPAVHDEESFDWLAQAFASRGYAVFQPNFRGSTNRDDAFRRAGDGQWGRRMQTDISDGLAELARRGIADPKRACIVGASYGGYAALAGVTLQQGLYRCSVAVAAVSDLEDMFWTDYRESGQNKMLRRNYQQSLGDPATLADVSPRKHAGKADAPILLIHGKDDTVVAFKQSKRMADALTLAGKPHELVELRGEDHWLSKAETRIKMLEAAVRFVQEHNPAD